MRKDMAPQGPPYYSVLSCWEIAAMTCAMHLSILLGVPIIKKCFQKKNTYFQGCIFIMAFASSIMFHTCQIFQTRIFMDKLDWQKIDNIFTITSLELVILIITGAHHPDDSVLKYSTLLSTIVVQEDDPWNFVYTIVPIVLYLFIGLTIRYLQRKKRKVIYKPQKLMIAIALLSMGTFFFVRGLDDSKDYLRLNHAFWHLFGTGFGYFMREAVEVQLINKQGYQKIEDQKEK